MEESPLQEGAVAVLDADAQHSSNQKSRTATPGHPTVNTHGEISQTSTASISLLHSSLNSTTPPPTNTPANLASSTNTMRLESQPMTAASSTSSSLPPTNDTTAPSPYGTRSRNRTSNSRPNYAEDREMEGEYEWPPSKKQLTTSAAEGSAQAVEVERTITTSRRRSVQSATGPVKPSSAGTSSLKDHIPGMSSFSVNSGVNTQPQSKKRKAPGNHATSTNSGPHSSTSRASSHAVPSSGATRETNMLTFETSQGYMKHGKLTADDGTRLGPNDFVYLVCEPPGEPYYIARIMEFVHADNNPNAPIDSLRINWAYRPRDIGRKVNDTRLVYATMHSEVCVLTSLRGKCQVLHRDKIASLDDYRKMKNCFYFSQVFDRYMRRFYDVIPTSQVTNVPQRVKKVLDQRWQFVLYEAGRGKELTSAIKACKRCGGFCASNESIDCAMCKSTWHMKCVKPPLPKKPARGFGWSCARCSRKQEKKLEARNTPLVGEKALGGEEEENLDEEEEDHGLVSNATTGNSPDNSVVDDSIRPATTEQIAQAKLWPYRYLGIHCNVEDVLDYDDRIYPRAISRLGPRHQANVHVWHGRPQELVKSADGRRKYLKGNTLKKDTKTSKDTLAALEADKLAREKRPKWVIDEPPGFVRRGDDHPNGDPANTAKVCFRIPQVGEASSRGEDAVDHPVGYDREKLEQVTEEYMERAKEIASQLGVAEYSTTYLDKALKLLYEMKFDALPALMQLQNMDPRKDLKEPRLSKEEVKRFEEGVALHGSSLRDITKHVGKPQKHGDIVRFYYMWKKTERGKQIWGNFEGRKTKKYGNKADAALVDDVADDVDDSAFDNDKAAARKRGFECKFCFTRQSRYWRRAPHLGGAGPLTVPADSGAKGGKDKCAQLTVALCQRCAGLWRRYAIQWENIDEVAKKVAQAGGRAWKRKMDEELLIELVNANEASAVGMSSAAAAAAASVGIDVPQSLTIQPGQEGSRKKLKGAADKESNLPSQGSVPPEIVRKKVIEKPPEPPLIPEQPKLLTLPCFVCNEIEPVGEELFRCRHCRLTVHRNCYGIPESRTASKWTCDMCANDATCQWSTSYECVLCPVRPTEHELFEPPKASHKKKTDREREKDRLEKEIVIESTTNYYREQDQKGWPLFPREALKRTLGKNWVHVTCAVWTPWIKFGNSHHLEPAEGIGSIPQGKYKQECKLCKTNMGVCVTCHKCPATFHVSCAQQMGYPMGFDVTPVKGSRRDVINTVTLGTESGSVEAVIYCKDHAVKSILHPMHEQTDPPTTNALQLFVRYFRQADLSLTGTVRKADIINSFIKSVPQPTIANGHRPSFSNALGNGVDNSPSVPATRSSRVSPAAVTVKSEEVDEEGDRIVHLNESSTLEADTKECSSCFANISPKWHERKLTAGRKSELTLATASGVISQASQPYLTETNGAIPHVSVENSAINGYGPIALNGRDPETSRELTVIGSSPISGTVADSLETTVSTRGYICHRCFLKKQREPSPQLSATQPEQPLESTRSASREVLSTEAHGSIPAPWTAVSSVRPSQHEPQPSEPLAQVNNSVHLANGLQHSPPQHLVNHAQPPYAAAPSHYFLNGYEQREQRHGSQHRHPMNGSPAVYQVPRNIPGPVEQLSYPAQVQSHGGPPYTRPMSNGNRSPPVHYIVTQAPPGPPRAAENPFLMPHHPHTSPRQHYNGMQGSPRHRGPDLRPETPTDGSGRNGGWAGNDGPITNGASASPSLRNLLH